MDILAWHLRQAWCEVTELALGTPIASLRRQCMFAGSALAVVARIVQHLDGRLVGSSWLWLGRCWRTLLPKSLGVCRS